MLEVEEEEGAFVSKFRGSNQGEEATHHYFVVNSSLNEEPINTKERVEEVRKAFISLEAAPSNLALGKAFTSLKASFIIQEEGVVIAS